MKNKKETSEERVLSLLRLKCICRLRGLEVDIKNNYPFKGRLQEYKELLSHLDDLKWIIADIFMFKI